MPKLRIAVSGVAGASGQSALKALRMIDGLDIETFPVDVTPYSAGLYWGTQPGTVLPKPEQNINAWIDFVRKNHIDALIPGADRDLIPLSDCAEDTRALVSRPEVIRIANDKYETAIFLSVEMEETVPDYALPESAYLWNVFPCVVKPRSDAASRGFHKCDDAEELHFYLKHTPNAMIQEYIDADEYTANVFVDSDGVPQAALVMLRKERGGIAIQARPVEDDEIHDLLYRIGAAIRPKGILSVQLRKPLDGPLPFEINARVSGSTIVRALCGYNDCQMLIEHYVLGKPVQQPTIDYDQHFFRYYSEVMIRRDQLAHTYGYREDWR